jgi:hypothetical protein
MSLEVQPILTDHRIVVLGKMLDTCNLAQTILAISKLRLSVAQQIVPKAHSLLRARIFPFF